MLAVGPILPRELYNSAISNVHGEASSNARTDKLVKGEVEKLLDRHASLVHSQRMRVMSHAQRKTRDWIVNTIMLEGYSVPFRFKRKRPYKNLTGQFVNLTYYPNTESVAGIDVEVMNVVRIRTS